VFTPPERDAVRERLIAAAREDPAVLGAAFTGSYAGGTADRWSDIDLALAIAGDVSEALARWTDLLTTEFGALHHWDLPLGATVYRVFLLPGWLEVDIAFAPESDFGPRGPHWRTLFANRSLTDPLTLPDPDHALADVQAVVGRCWHHVLHAAASLHRTRVWQADWWITELRRHVVELTCHRLGLPTSYGRGMDDLPAETRAQLRESLAAAPTFDELARSLGATADLLLFEVSHLDDALAQQLQQMVREIDGSLGVCEDDRRRGGSSAG
jgi:predicted nucleotidyltransferase